MADDPNPLAQFSNLDPPPTTFANPLGDTRALPGTNALDQSSAPDPNDYLTNFDPNTVMDNPAFLSDLRKYYEARDGHAPQADDDLKQQFWDDRTYRNVNSIGIGSDWIGAANQSNDMNALEGKIQTVYQRMPDFWQQGGRGAYGLAENVGMMAADPINALPLGELFKALQGVGIAVDAAKAGSGALAAGIKQAAGSTLREAGIMGTMGAGYDAMSQGRDMTLGIQPSFNWAELAISAGTQAALGGVPAALGATWRGTAAARNMIDQIRAWPDARGAEVAKLETLKTAANNAEAAGNADVAAQEGAKANAQQATINAMDAAYRNRGGSDQELGIAPTAEEAVAPPADADPEAANRAKLEDMKAGYLQEIQNQHVDPGAMDNTVLQGKLDRINAALDYERQSANIGQQIATLQQRQDRGAAVNKQIDQLRTQLDLLGANRDNLLGGAPKTDAEMQQAVDAHDLGVGPNRGFGIDVYGQPAPPTREGLAVPGPEAAPGGAAAPVPSGVTPGGGGAPPAASAPIPAGAPRAPGELPVAAAPAAAPTPEAAPAPAPTPAGAGGGGGGGGAATAAAPAVEPPEIATATAETPAASAAEVAAETPDQKRARLKGQKATAAPPAMTLTSDYQPVPEGTPVPPEAHVVPDPARPGQWLARLAPHPITEAPTEVIAQEAARLDPGLTTLLDQVHDTKGYKYTGETGKGKVSIEEALTKAGYDGETAAAIIDQIKAKVKGVPAVDRANIQREMVTEAVVAKQLEDIEYRLEQGGIEPSVDILKDVVDKQIKNPRIAAVAQRVLDGDSKLRFGADEAPTGSFAEEYARQMEARTSLTDEPGGGGETAHYDPNGMSREAREIFRKVAIKETDKHLATLGLSQEAGQRFQAEAAAYTRIFLDSSYLPGSHEARLGSYRQFLAEMGKRYVEQESGRMAPPMGRALGERGAQAAGEAKYGNPDEIYKRNPLRPEKRAGIPALLKRANQAGIIGKGIGKADIGTVGEWLARADLEGWRDVRAVMLNENYRTADGVNLKKGDKVYINPVKKKAYADPLLAGRRDPAEPGVQSTGGQTRIPAIPTAKEEAFAKEMGIDPVGFATRLRDMDPKIALAKGDLETEAGGTIPNGTKYIRTIDGGIYKDDAELRAALADQMKAEPPPAPAAAPAAPPAPEGLAISPEVRAVADAAGITDPATIQRLQAAAEKNGMLREGPTTPAPEPVEAAGTATPVPDNWAPPPGRKVSIRNVKTGQVRTLSPNQRSVEDMLAGKPRDDWEIGSNKQEISSGQVYLAQKDFIPAGQEPPALTTLDEVTAAPKVVDPGEMLTTEQAERTVFPEPIVVKDLSGNIVSLKTALDAAKALRDMHTAGWPKDRGAMAALIQDIEVLTKALPGVKQPSVTRQAARQALTDLFQKLAPDELRLALDALRRLPGSEMPDFAEIAPQMGDRQGLGTFSGYEANQATTPGGDLLSGGVIGLADPRATNLQDYPLITVLHHELGHWGYDNLLSNEERLSYLKWVLDTFYKGGTLDEDLVRQVAPTRTGAATPQEMFAAMFQKYVAGNGKLMTTPMPTSLMRKFTTYLGKFIARWFGKTTDIDRTLEPLFAKIMPDPSADSWLRTLGSEGTTDEGRALVDSIRALDKGRHAIEVGLQSSNPVVIESGIRTAMNAISRSTESLGREMTDRLNTRLADIIKASEAVSRAYDPELASARTNLEARGINPEESWRSMDEGERRVLQNAFETGDLASVGSEIPIDNNEGWRIASHVEGSDPKNPTFIVEREVENGIDSIPMTRLDLAKRGAGHIVPSDQYDMTRLVLTNNNDPVLAAAKAGNEAHNVLADAFAEHNAAFNRIEGAGNTALRVDNPMTLGTAPEGSRSAFAMAQQVRLNGVLDMLQNIETKSTTDFIEAMDEIARVTGRTGVSRKGVVGDWFGRPHFGVRGDLTKVIRARGRDLVDEAYQLLTDFNPKTEAEYTARRATARKVSDAAMAGVPEYEKNVTVSLGSMTEEQRIAFNSLVQRAKDLVPDLYKELDGVRRKWDGRTRAAMARGTYVPGRKVSNATVKTNRARRIAEVATKKRPRLQDEVRGNGGSPELGSPKGMSQEQLADGIVKHGARTKLGLTYGTELLARDKTEPFLPHIRIDDIPNNIIQMDTNMLGVALKTAIEGGDKKTADLVRKEAFRRAQKNAIRRGPIDVADGDVVASINREMRHTMGEPDHVGVPEGAPAVVKEALARFTHRKADVQTALRTAMYRLFNLGGITDAASRDGITAGRLFRLAGREVPGDISPSATIFDIREPAFSEVRSAMRRLVGNFAEGKGDPHENISNMVEMVLRSGLVNDHEYGDIHDAYHSTGDSIKRDLERSGVTPEERRPDAWFADHVSNYLMGEHGTAELFKADPHMAEPGFSDVLQKIKNTAERVKDATAYVVNGLMHDDMRREFPSLTDYGDVFEGARGKLGDTPRAPAGMEEQGVLNENAMNPEAPRLSAIIINSIVHSQDTLDMDRLPSASLVVSDAAEKGGAGPRTNKLVAAGVNGMKKVEAMPEAFRWNFGHIYKRGSDLMRQYGMNWFGDILNPRDGAGLYHKITVKGADYLMPLIRMANQMPDAHGMLGDWLRRNKFWRDAAQPASHARVVEALRGFKALESLSPQERRLHDAFRTSFDRGLKELRDAGVPVGDAGRYYFPQVWNEEAMLRNREGAIKAIGRYLQDESRSPNSVLATHLTEQEGLEKAADIFEGITNNGGVYMPPKAERRASKADNLDYQRFFRLNETIKDAQGRTRFNPDGSPMMRYQATYDLMKPFLHNHLEAVADKYFNALARRVVTTAELGVNSHMYFDYTHVMQGGREQALERATRLMATNKIIRQNFMRQADNGGFEEATRSIDAYHAMDHVEAEGAVRDAIDEMMGGGAGDVTRADIQRGIDVLVSRMRDQNTTGKRRAAAVMNALADMQNMKGTPPGRDEFARADAAYRVAMQKPIGAQSNIARKSIRLLQNFNSLTMLGFTTLTATTDLMYPLLRHGDLGALARAWTNFASDPAYRAMMRNTGAALEQLSHDKLSIIYGDQGSRLTRTFFNLNMLTHWDSMVRELGSAVAWESFKAEQQRAFRAGRNTRAWRNAEARLKRYGLDHYLTNKQDLGNRSLLNIDTGDPVLRQGIIKAVNEMVFTHTPDDIPLWAQTPGGKLLFQLKSFATMMGRLTMGHGGILHQAGQFFASRGKEGSVMPLVYMLTLGTGWSMGTNALKDIVQGRGGAQANQHQLRQRGFTELAKKFGWDPNLHGPADTFLGNYAEGFMMLGGFGFLTDLLYQAGQNADNGAWGYQRTLGSILGPSFEDLSTVYEGGVAAKDALIGAKSPATGRSNERSFVTDVARRVPIFGGMGSVRSFLADQIAGPSMSKAKEAKAASTTGYGGGYNPSGQGYGTGYGG